ncbi:MAG: RNA methyltransferase [Azoarcus sp.]|jgi:TrmH family RNA methyltransferase|nr:RNA methyltransferase [Azoarcus sp.]
MLEITSRDNPRIKLLAALVDDARARREHGQTVLDGIHLLDCALNAHVPLLEVCVSASARAHPEVAALLARLPAGTATMTVPDALFARISPVDTPVGILARMTTPSVLPTSGWISGNDTSLVVLDAVQDPGNLGTILRTVAAVGIGTVWLTPGCARAWSPRVLRAGMGAHFRLEIAEQVDAAERLLSHTGKVIATALMTEGKDIYALDLIPPAVWLFGGEGQGISPMLRARATDTVTIPMASGIESLNVGAAVAVCLFEQQRQRRLAVFGRVFI